MLFPQPDSPTMPTILPRGTDMDTSLTALISPFCVKKLVHRCSTHSTVALSIILPPLLVFEMRVEYIAQAVAEEIERQHDNHNGDARR